MLMVQLGFVGAECGALTYGCHPVDAYQSIPHATELKFQGIPYACLLT